MAGRPWETLVVIVLPAFMDVLVQGCGVARRKLLVPSSSIFIYSVQMGTQIVYRVFCVVRFTPGTYVQSLRIEVL